MASKAQISEITLCEGCGRTIPLIRGNCPHCGAEIVIPAKPVSRLRAALEMTGFIVAIPALTLIGFLILAVLRHANAMMTMLAVVGVVGLIGFYALAPTKM